MERDHAMTILRSLRPQLEARGIEHAGLFGSVGRGEAGSGSDIDIVVGPSNRRTLDLIDIGGIQDVLERAFDGYLVDVVVTPIRKPSLRASIDRDRIDAF